MSIRLAIFISGSGSTAEAILTASKHHTLSGVTPVVVISSTPKASGIAKAKALGFPCEIVDRTHHKTGEAYGDALLKILTSYHVDAVSQNGWLPLTPGIVVNAYKNRIINQHPGPLDPGRSYDFGGKGMFGLRVSVARVAFCWLTGHEYWTESTVHMVNDSYDKGNLVRVKRSGLPIPKKQVTLVDLQNDPSELLAAARDAAKTLLLVEHANVLSVLRALGANGSVSGYRRKTALIPEREQQVFIQSKHLAQKLVP